MRPRANCPSPTRCGSSARCFEAVAFKGERTTHGRTFLKVYGRHRVTGVRYLLLYERGTERRRPIEVIELASIEDSTIVGRQDR